MDIWSCGVIMAELFAYICQADNSKLTGNLEIFHGSHCFPLSPKSVNFDPDGLPKTDGDILESIFDLIGTPSDLDLAFITDQDARSYIKKFKKRPEANLYDIFPQIS